MGGEALLVSRLEGTFKADGEGPTEGRRGPRVLREGSAFVKKRFLTPPVQGKKERLGNCKWLLGLQRERKAVPSRQF